MRPYSGRVARGLSWFPFLFVLHSLITSPALLLTLVDTDFKVPFDTIDEIEQNETLFSSRIPVYFIALINPLNNGNASRENYLTYHQI